MTSRVVYEGDLRTTCTHLRSGSEMETDAPVDNNGKGERFSPTDSLATSLASCMITTMGIKAKNLGVNLDGVEIEVEKIMRNDPRRIAGINLFFHIPGSLDGVEKSSKDLLKNVGENCPVMLSLHPDIDVKVDWGEWKQ